MGPDVRINIQQGENSGLHVKAKCAKATRMLHALGNAVGRLWGPSTKTLRWTYTQVVRPAVMYGSIIWAH